MKTCPSCGRHYEDDSLVFCLQDGARLAQVTGGDLNATLHVPPTQPPPTVFQTPAAPAQSTITARPEQFHRPGRQTAAESAGEARRHNPLPWILAIVFVIGMFGVLIAWIVTSGTGNEVSNRLPTPLATATVPASTPEPTIERREATPERRETPTSTPRPTPEPTKPKPMFSVMDNTSMDGSRITYYPRPSFGLCQADCARNPNCRGFTWIRPGAYNSGDSAMCYLMASVTGRSSHACCISAVRN